MSNPKVTVIIPIYKAESYLRKCLNSFLEQTLQDIEIVLVDDGSPDNSGRICEEYSSLDSRFKTYHKPNGGVSNARQYGLEHAAGEFVIHADPDDWADCEMLEELYNNAIANSADVVICDFFKSKDDRQEYVRQKPIALDPPSVINSLYNGLYGACWNKLIRKSVIDKYHISFPEGWSLAEDQFFCISLLQHDVTISYVDKAFYHYVIGDNENSLAFATKRSYDYDVMMYNSFNDLTKNTPNNKVVKSVYAYTVINNEFVRHESNNRQFIEKCMPYVFGMLASPTSFRTKVMFLLSCIGLYKPIYNLWYKG